MNSESFEHACDLMHDKLQNKEHLWVQEFLQVTAPSAPFLQVCEHMLSLNQKHLLESEVENLGQHTTKRKI